MVKVRQKRVRERTCVSDDDLLGAFCEVLTALYYGRYDANGEPGKRGSRRLRSRLGGGRREFKGETQGDAAWHNTFSRT